MARKNGKRNSTKSKFWLVLETLQRESADAAVFGGSEEVAEYEKRVGDLERMVGQKEVEIALLKNFLNGR